MSVHACIMLKKIVDDLDKADDWFAEVRAILDGKTACRMDAQSTNHERPIEIQEVPDGG